MLSKHEVRWCFTTLWFASILCVLPLDVDRKRGKICLTKSRIKKWGFQFQFAISVLHAWFLCVTWIRMLISPGGYKPIETTIQPVALLCALLSMYNAVELLINNPQATVLVFNELYGETDEKVAFRWLEYTFQELFAIFSFTTTYLGWSMIFPLILLEPKSSFFVGSLCDLNSIWRVVFFWPLEISVIFFICGPLNLSIFMQLSTFQQTSSAIKNQIQQLGSEKDFMDQTLTTAMTTCRRIQLSLALFNLRFAYVHYFIKLAALTTSVVCIFCGLKWLQSDPISAVPMLVTGIEIIIGFVMMYDNAFGIPAVMSDLKERIMMVSILCENKGKHMYTIRAVRAVRNKGIEVGAFSTFERTSTPDFVDFVVNNVVNLLLTF